MALTQVLAKGIHWDLSELYKSSSDPKIKKDTAEIHSLVADFITSYKGKIYLDTVSATVLSQAIEKYERILEKVTILSAFASYLHSTDTADQRIGKFYQETRELDSTVSAKLTWFEIEILRIKDSVYENLHADQLLKKYQTYLANVRKYKPFTLTESEEIILTKKAQTSTQAFIRLFDEVDGSNTYEMKLGNEKKILNYSQLTPYMTSHPERQIRKTAAQALTTGLANKEKLYSYTLNMLLQDKAITDEIRGYSYPQEASFLKYGLKKETVETMVRTIEQNYSISEKFYKAKSRYLGIETLHEWDRYSFIGNTKPMTYTWDEAKEIVISSFRKFSPRFAEIAEKFFKNNWIHAEITPHKRAGAYCSYNSPKLHPFILVNFAGQIRDVTTLAHELGHGIHGYLSRDNTYLQAWPSTVIAEIASIFSEMFVFDTIYQSVSDKDVRLNLLIEQTQSIFASVFRQNAFYLFETDIHIHRRTKGELTIEDFNNYFQKRLQAMFGKGLILTPGHANWWMTILHFYRYNFYVFSYSFGEMLSLSLYARYKEKGESFVENYTRALSLGSSKNPYEITKTMGIDIQDQQFWNNGLAYINRYVDEFENATNTK